MPQITARVSERVVAALYRAVRCLNRSRAAMVRQALDRYVEGFLTI